MPHKRAKRSVRDQERAKHNSDLDPTSSRNVESEGIPKALSRVLDAERIQKIYHERKRAAQQDEHDGDASTKRKKRKLDTNIAAPQKNSTSTGIKTATPNSMQIKPGESLAHFNRRVEDDMRPLVKTAMSSASAHTRKSTKPDPKPPAPKTGKGKAPASISHPADDDTGSDSDNGNSTNRATEFAVTRSSAPKRLNDIAQAPPSFARLPKERGTAAALARLKGEKKGHNKAEGVVSKAQRARMEEERERAVQRYRELKASKMQERTREDSQ